MIRLSKAYVNEEELINLKNLFEGSCHFGLGASVEEFEQKMQDTLQTKRSIVCVNTGTSALHLALDALGFKKGAEVLVPSLTFVACYQAIIQAGLKPVAVDVSFPSGHIDPEDLEKRIAKNSVAIMPVSYTGIDFDRSSIYTIAKKHNLRVIEDNAHAFYSINQDDHYFGNSGDISCFSFDGIKNITCGEGGAIVTDDEEFAYKIKIKRSLGIEKDVKLRYKGQRAWNYEVSTQGFRYHMSNINAAIGLAQLDKVEKTKQIKLDLVKTYHQGIESYSLVDFLSPLSPIDPKANYHIFPCLLAQRIKPEIVRDKLKELGIESGFHYAPNHLHPLFKSGYSLENTEAMAKRLISLPLHPGLGVYDIHKILKGIQKILETEPSIYYA